MFKISEKRYEETLAVAEEIMKNTDNPMVTDHRLRFDLRDAFPSIAQLKQHKVEEKLSLYFPYLLFYGEVYEPDADEPEEVHCEWQLVKSYIKRLLNAHVELEFAVE